MLDPHANTAAKYTPCSQVGTHTIVCTTYSQVPRLLRFAKQLDSSSEVLPSLR